MAKKMIITVLFLVVAVAASLCFTGRHKEDQQVTVRKYLHAPPGVHIYKNTGAPLH